MSRREKSEARQRIEQGADGKVFIRVGAEDLAEEVQIIAACQRCGRRLLTISNDVLSTQIDPRNPKFEEWTANPDPQWFQPMVEIHMLGAHGQRWCLDSPEHWFAWTAYGGRAEATVLTIQCEGCQRDDIQMSWDRHRPTMLSLWLEAEQTGESRRLTIKC